MNSNGCLKLADQGFNSFNARRENEWKVGLSMWTLIIVTTRYVLLDPQVKKAHAVVGVCAGFVVLLHAGFVYGVWTKNHFDEHVFRYFSGRAADMVLGRKTSLSVPAVKPKSFYDVSQLFGFVKDGSSLFQILTTLILCVVCGYVSR
jgi:hypothetical protein